MKAGDRVEFTDEHGNLRRGRVTQPPGPALEMVGIEYTSVDYFPMRDADVKVVSAVEQLGAVAETVDPLAYAISNIEAHIQLMLEMPGQFAYGGEMMEARLVTALTCWSMAAMGCMTEARVCRAHLKIVTEFAKERGYTGPPNLASIAGIDATMRDPVTDEETIPVVVERMGVLWDRLRDPIEQLGQLAEADA